MTKCDSVVGVAVIMGHSEVTVNCQNIVHRLRGLLQDFESVVVQHVEKAILLQTSSPIMHIVLVKEFMFLMALYRVWMFDYYMLD